MNLKKGDIITAYIKGFHEVTRVEEYPFPSKKGLKTLVYYTRRLNDNGNEVPSEEYFCNISFCEKITQRTIDARFVATMKQAKKLKEATENLIKNEK